MSVFCVAYYPEATLIISHIGLIFSPGKHLDKFTTTICDIEWVSLFYQRELHLYYRF